MPGELRGLCSVVPSLSSFVPSSAPLLMEPPQPWGVSEGPAVLGRA